LATEILGYGWNPKAGEFGKGLTEWLHKPLCRWYDETRDEHYRGLYMPRWSHKTTLAVVWEIQEELRDPNSSAFYFHAVDENAAEFVQECGHHWQHNDKLRALDPVLTDRFGQSMRITPTKANKRWLGADKYTLRRTDYSRFPTLFGKGAGSEITGKHASRAWPDDIVGRRTIENNMLGSIQRWWQNTVIPVVDDRKFFSIGTRWHYEALYERWILDKRWRTIVLPSSVELVDGKDFFECGGLDGICDLSQKKIIVPSNYKLNNPIYGTPSTKNKQVAKLRDLKKEMGPDFATQMMNDPLPETERVWVPTRCEHYIDVRDIKPHRILVLSDPAPRAMGSGDNRMERQRGDGSKDYWAIAVVGIQRRGDVVQRILLDGDFSREWDEFEGCEVAAGFQQKYHTPHVAFDEIGRKWAEFHRKICIRLGARYSWISMKSLMKGKAFRISRLAALAANGEFLVSKTCPPAFLEEFLSQIRRYPQVRYDDVIDSVALCVDEAINDHIPTTIAPEAWNPYRQSESEDQSIYKGRYISY